MVHLDLEWWPPRARLPARCRRWSRRCLEQAAPARCRRRNGRCRSTSPFVAAPRCRRGGRCPEQAAAACRRRTTERRASCLTAAKAAAATATKGRAAKGRSTAFTFAFTASAFTFALAFATAFATTASSTAEDRTTTAAASTTEDRTTTTASSTTEDRATLPTAAKDGHANPTCERVGRAAARDAAAPRAQGEALLRTTFHVTSESTQSEDSKFKRYACTLKCLTQPRGAARPVAFCFQLSLVSSQLLPTRVV